MGGDGGLRLGWPVGPGGLSIWVGLVHGLQGGAGLVGGGFQHLGKSFGAVQAGVVADDPRPALEASR